MPGWQTGAKTVNRVLCVHPVHVHLCIVSMLEWHTSCINSSTNLFCSSALLTQVKSYPMCLLFCRQQVHIVCDEERPSSHYCCTPPRNKLCGPIVRTPFWLLQLCISMLVQDCMCVHLLVRVCTFVCVLVSFVRGCHYAHALSILWLKLSTEWSISNFILPPTTAAMLIVSPWFGNIWENGRAIWFIWFMSPQLLSVELEEPWCYIHQLYYLCLKCWYIYTLRGPL